MKWWICGVLPFAFGFVAERAEARVEFDVGARLGYAVPMGKVAEKDSLDPVSSEKLSDWVKGQVPLALELNVRVIPMLALGGYAELAPAIIGSEVSDGCDASSRDCFMLAFHLGLMAHFHVLPHQPIDPWVGLGIGLETLGVSAKDSDQTQTTTLGGFEVPLRIGVDFKLSEKFYLGPYVGYSFGTFGGFSRRCEGDACPSDQNIDIENTASHGWFGFGAKLTVLAF
jgi:hypothetical protein